jgi:hypothetical protein
MTTVTAHGMVFDVLYNDEHTAVIGVMCKPQDAP